MSGARQKLCEAGLWVVKIGSALLTDNGRNLHHDAIAGWCGQIAVLREGGRRVILVSSGAVAEGCRRLGLASRPESVHELQAAAAAGQMGTGRGLRTGAPALRSRHGDGAPHA